MKKTGNIFILCFFLIVTIGKMESTGQGKLDSLENILSQNISDSVRIQTLIELSRQSQYIDFTKSNLYANKALTLAEQKKWVWAKTAAYIRISFLSELKGDYSSALKYNNLNLQKAIDDTDSLMIAFSLNNIGNNYLELGKFDEAYYYFTQSYKISRAINNQFYMAVAIYNTGLVLNELGQYDLALNHFKISQEMGEKNDDIEGKAYTNDAIGEVYLKKKDYKKSEEYLLKSLSEIRKHNIIILKPRVIKKLAQLKFEKKEFDKALLYYDSALAIYNKSNNEFGVAEINLGRSDVLIGQEKFDEANLLINQALVIAQANNAERMIIDCNKKLSHLAEEKGDFKNSLAYLKTFNQLEDSLFSREMLSNIFQDQLSIQTELKDSEIAALSRAKSQQESELRREELLRNILVVVIALTIFLLFTVYRSGQRRLHINQLLVEHQKEIKRRSQELEQLNQVKDKFISIVSHDLRSPINSLAGMLDLAENENLTPEEFKQLSSGIKKQFDYARTLISNLLDWALIQMDKLKIQPVKVELTNVVNDNLKLVETMQTKNVKLLNNVPSGVFGWGDLNMLNLILRNLILNAIKFSENNGEVEIFISKKDDQFVTMAVRDHGVGISAEAQKLLFDKTSGYSTRGTANEKGTGLGLILCKEFVEKNGGQISLDSQEGKGSTFYFTIPRPTE